MGGASDEYITHDNPVHVIDALVDQLELHELGFARAMPESTAACRTCPMKARCTRNKRSRRIRRWVDEQLLEEMAAWYPDRVFTQSLRLLGSTGAPTRSQQSNTDQQMSFRNR